MCVSLHRTTEYSVYSPETYEGHWKQLTVRTTRTKQAMAMIFFNPQVLTHTPGPLLLAVKPVQSKVECLPFF